MKVKYWRNIIFWTSVGHFVLPFFNKDNRAFGTRHMNSVWVEWLRTPQSPARIPPPPARSFIHFFCINLLLSGRNSWGSTSRRSWPACPSPPHPPTYRRPPHFTGSERYVWSSVWISLVSELYKCNAGIYKKNCFPYFLTSYPRSSPSESPKCASNVYFHDCFTSEIAPGLFLSVLHRYKVVFKTPIQQKFKRK